MSICVVYFELEGGKATRGVDNERNGIFYVCVCDTKHNFYLNK